MTVTVEALTVAIDTTNGAITTTDASDVVKLRPGCAASGTSPVLRYMYFVWRKTPPFRDEYNNSKTKYKINNTIYNGFCAVRL